MKNSLIKPRSAAIISVIICLPFAFLFTLILLDIEPNFGLLQPMLNNSDPNQPDVIGSLIALGTFVLVLAAFMINFTQIRQTMQAGGSITTNPVNLILVVVTFSAIALAIGSIIVDQYPCWVGVPNCD